MKHTCRYCTKDIVYVEAGLCGACYQYIRNWMKRTPTAMLRRIDQIQVWESRLEDLLGNVKKTRRKAA